MWQITAVILILILTLFVFIPLSYLNENYQERQNIKQNLNLSAKALLGAIEKKSQSVDGLSNGHFSEDLTNIQVNKELLLENFYELLYKNYYQKRKFDKVKEQIIIKVLVYEDRFFIADQQDKWSPPYFFSMEDPRAQRLLYFNTINDNVYYYDNNGIMTWESLDNCGMNSQGKNEIIINKINEVIAQYTSTEATKNGLEIKIKNPDKLDVIYQMENKHFNVLEGITFFVVYTHDTKLSLYNKSFKYDNYSVVGYTMENSITN